MPQNNNIPKSIVLLIFQYIPQTVWCLNKSQVLKIQTIKKKWEQLSTRFQSIIFLRRYKEFPDHAYIFQEAIVYQCVSKFLTRQGKS